MNAPTYSLGQSAASGESYLDVVRRLTDRVVKSGAILRPVIDAYAEFLEVNGREGGRSEIEYLLEALTLGVMWRARGAEANAGDAQRSELVTELVRARRGGASKRRDGTESTLVSLEGSPKRGRIDPTLQEIQQLLDWMLATGEYDGELSRLEGWRAFLATTPAATNREILRLIVAAAVGFEAMAGRELGRFTAGVERFLSQDLKARSSREDIVQCSRRRVEYHLNMVGAEMLNRAWRDEFLACVRHVVVLPGCTRSRDAAECRSAGDVEGGRCTHCTLGCGASAATRLAERFGGSAIVVCHDSEFSRALGAPTLAGPSVGIVGVACVAGIIGAGWRARARGFPAQCVILNAPGCTHWQDAHVPAGFDPAEMTRILTQAGEASCAQVAPRVA